jgi:DNA invertase Pin-like site-specific DNA recombinase
MNIAYVRVSTIDQNEQRQTEGLEKFGIEKWFSEKVSAKDMNRPRLMEMIEFAREGDTIHVHDLSRLARSTKDLLQIIETLEEKKVSLISGKESFDTGSATGKLMITMIGAISEFERANMLERQREGIEIAKRKKKYRGRNKIRKPDNWDSVMADYRTRKITAKKAIGLLGLRRTTFYQLIKDCGTDTVGV